MILVILCIPNVKFAVNLDGNIKFTLQSVINCIVYGGKM